MLVPRKTEVDFIVNILPLDKLIFGKTDALNELTDFGEDWFVRAFFPYAKYKIDDFINGKSYYICGEKGTGKTALLKYLQCKLAESRDNLIIPIRFKSDFDNEDKKSMVRAAANVKEATAEGLEDFKEGTDAVIVWQVYILNKLLSKSEETGEYQLFEEDKTFRDFRVLLKVVYPQSINRIVPELKRGQIKIGGNFKDVLSGELQLEIGLKDAADSISFNHIAKNILSKFEKLHFWGNTAYILFDELELSIRSPKEHTRDIKLVRDLVLAIDRLNGICKSYGYDIHIIASVRTEVIKSVHAAGFEINKSIEDYGVSISWYQRGGNYQSNQLLKLIENKIIASEELNGITEHGNIWEKYFPSTINGIDTRRYILNYSWMHPRDIVRLMNQVLLQHDTETKFTQEMFDRAMKDYSARSWGEIVEEMSLKYRAIDIAAIKSILTNVEVPFTFSYLSQRVNQLKEMDETIDDFNQRFRLADMLKDLFSFGIIGNTGARMIFKFMEDDDLSLAEDMIIHKPLRNFFAVKSRPATHVDLYEDIN